MPFKRPKETGVTTNQSNNGGGERKALAVVARQRTLRVLHV